MFEINRRPMIAEIRCIEEEEKKLMKADKQNYLSYRLMEAILNDKLAVKIPWWKRIFRKGSCVRSFQSRSKYTPHQNAREKARCLKRIAKGMIGDAHV